MWWHFEIYFACFASRNLLSDFLFGKLRDYQLRSKSVPNQRENPLCVLTVAVLQWCTFYWQQVIKKNGYCCIWKTLQPFLNADKVSYNIYICVGNKCIFCISNLTPNVNICSYSAMFCWIFVFLQAWIQLLIYSTGATWLWQPLVASLFFCD